MVLGLAEMSSAMPAAGAGYGFARRAMGKVGGALTGFAILIQYTICPAAISTFIAAYVHALGLFADIPSVAIIGFFFIAFVGIHLIGVGEALKIVFRHYRYCHDRPYRFRCWHCASLRSGESLQYRPCRRWGYGTSAFRCCLCDFCSPHLVFGCSSLLRAFPWQRKNRQIQRRRCRKGIIGAMLTLMVTGALVLFLTAGGAGAGSPALQACCRWLTH